MMQHKFSAHCLTPSCVCRLDLCVLLETFIDLNYLAADFDTQ